MKPATLGDAAAAEGEEQARQLDARKRAAGGLRGERDVTKLGLAASGDGRRGRCNWLNRYARPNFCVGLGLPSLLSGIRRRLSLGFVA